MSVEILLPIVTSPPSPPAGKANTQAKPGSIGFDEILQSQLDHAVAGDVKTEAEPAMQKPNLDKSKAVTNDNKPTQEVKKGEDLPTEKTDEQNLDTDNTQASPAAQLASLLSAVPVVPVALPVENTNLSAATLVVEPAINVATEDPTEVPAAVITDTSKPELHTVVKTQPVQVQPEQVQPTKVDGVQQPLTDPVSVDQQSIPALEQPKVVEHQPVQTAKVEGSDNQSFKIDTRSKADTVEPSAPPQTIEPTEAIPASKVAETNSVRLNSTPASGPQSVTQNMEAAVVEDADPPPVAKSGSPAEVLPAAVEQLSTKTAAPIHQFTEPARLAEAQTTNILQQITNQLDGLVRSGRQTLHLQLNPQDLGTIDMKVTHTQQGVSVSLMAENGATGKLLETQLGQLRQTLMEAGVQINQLHVGVHSGSGGSGQGFNQGTRSSRHTDQNRMVQTHSIETMGENHSSSSLVDYKI